MKQAHPGFLVLTWVAGQGESKDVVTIAVAGKESNLSV